MDEQSTLRNESNLDQATLRMNNKPTNANIPIFDDSSKNNVEESTKRMSDENIRKSPIEPIGDDSTRRMAHDDTSTQRITDSNPLPTIDNQISPDNQNNIIDTNSNNQFYILRGKIYTKIKTLSESSGEAQIILVERNNEKYVLKLYYPNFSPEDGMLQVIWNMNFELIVNVFDYGKVIINNTQRDYELMEYLEGPSLIEFRLFKNEETFRKIALSAAEIGRASCRERVSSPV